MIYKFLIKIILPQSNYGSFLDNEAAEPDYNTIDKHIADLLKDLFQSGKSTDETIWNLCEPIANGG